MIYYIKGDATRPIGQGNKIIIHCCNNENKWGLGFVLALSKRWKQPENVYRAMSKEERILGNISLVNVENDIWVVNMIGQDGVKPINNIPPIRYDSIKKCLIKINEIAHNLNATIHAPKFGSGLAGGRWEEIEKIINDTVSVDVYVYDLN